MDEVDDILWACVDAGWRFGSRRPGVCHPHGGLHVSRSKVMSNAAPLTVSAVPTVRGKKEESLSLSVGQCLRDRPEPLLACIVQKQNNKEDQRQSLEADWE
jgi:hypothetical protein